MYICVIKLRNIDKSKIEVKRIISEIANATNRSLSVLLWQDWVYRILSTTSVDEIKKCKDIISAYFGESVILLEQYCNQNLKRILPLYLAGFKKGTIPLEKVEVFCYCCTDEVVLNEIEQIKNYAKDIALLQRFIKENKRGCKLDDLLSLMRQCESVEIKDEMLQILKSSSIENVTEKESDAGKTTIINKVAEIYERELGEMIITPYNRNEALRQYGLSHLIDR